MPEAVNIHCWQQHQGRQQRVIGANITATIMSRAPNSPTSRLLQNSRLFSLPRGLPPAQLERVSASGQYRASDTATLPYPTHQAITTPASSKFRGDWGLKRPLPAKSTRYTSTPVVRVYRQDTPQHITDFASAADHVLSERKWAQMGIPIMRRSTAYSRGNLGRATQHSAYEDSTDNVAKEDELPSDAPQGLTPESQVLRRRWRSEGPWIAGMQEGEFEQWLKKSLGKALDEDQHWMGFVRERYRDKRVAEAQSRLRSKDGQTLSGDELARFKTLLEPSEEETRAYLKKLRDEHQAQSLASELTTIICDYFDLPRHQAADNKTTPGLLSKLMQAEYEMSDDLVGGTDLERAPPTTHPAAGLGFIRTGAFMENHPIHGPQAYRSPVHARVMKPRTLAIGSSDRQARLGVGGFVAVDPVNVADPQRHNAMAHRASEAEDPAGALDPDVEGGNKIWVRPDSAFINEVGRVVMQVSRSDNEAQKVKTGDVQGLHESKFNQKIPEAGDGRPRSSRLGPITGEEWPHLRRSQSSEPFQTSR